MLLRGLMLMAMVAGTMPGTSPSAGTIPLRPVDRISLVVSSEPQRKGVQRIGMNLGIWTSWGAEQLGSNIIRNPGFEGLTDGALASVKSIHGATVVLDGPSVHRPSGFWNGASINFRTGVSAGKTGRIKEFSGTGSIVTQALLDSEIVAAPGDIVALTKVDDVSAPTQWWFSENQNNCLPGPPRPGSVGLRSLVLCSTESQRAEANSFLDGTTSRSGKMLPIRGRWKCTFWSKSLVGAPKLKISFTRTGSKPFFDREPRVTSAWQPIVIDFEATDDGPDGPLQLQFLAIGEGKIAVDDVSLARVSDGSFPFRHEVVAALETLRPGYLRDWQGQLGDTVSNRLAPPFARRASRYRSDRLEDAKYEYSIPEFLQLCQRVGASPWLVLPTTMSDEEYVELGSYLAATEKQLHFREVLVEFGNENWNPLFSAAGIQDGKRHGEAAARAFLHVRKGAGSAVPLRTVVNAQFANPYAVDALARENAADMVAVAPYFAYDLQANSNNSQTDAALFGPAREALDRLVNNATQNRAELAVYEVNLHTVGGNAGDSERDRFVLSAEAGSALAMRLIDGLSAGVPTQCVYTLAGYDAYTAERKGFVQLWGVVRDLAGPPRLRATGFAVSMLNQSIQDEMYSVLPQGNESSSNLSAVAFRGHRGWTAAIVSGRNKSLEVSLSFPSATGGKRPVLTRTLTRQTDGESNDLSPQYGNATVVSEGGRAIVRFVVPPRSFVVLLPEPAETKSTTGAAI